jgi:HSP20 family molecular chaperone IbpA
MDFDYTRRDYLLPPGCKDLIDVIKPAGDMELVEVATHDGLVITARLPNLRSDSIEIVIEGRQVRIVRKLSGSQAPHKCMMEVPDGYELSKAQATYIDDALRIFIPKCPV